MTPADLARRARAKEDDSIVFPQRVPGVGEAALVLRPLVNVGSPIGVGLLSTLEASYWGGSYFVGVRVDPIGLGVTADGSIVATSALAEGGYDGQAFLVGLGFGVSAVNGNLDYMLDDSDYMYATDDAGYTYEVVDQQETHFAFTLSQVARLGARDGLRLWVRNLLLLHREDGLNTDGTGYEEQSGFIYGGTSAELSIPTGRRADFFVEGGGGLMGYWFAGAGVSTWIYGNGSPGSWRLSVSAGGAGISGSRKVTQTYYDGINPPTETTYDETVSIMGPMVSIGIARRFSF